MESIVGGGAGHGRLQQVSCCRAGGKTGGIRLRGTEREVKISSWSFCFPGSSV